MIHNAVKEINRLTCVRWVPRFVPRTRITLSNLVGHTSYVLIDDLGQGCVYILLFVNVELLVIIIIHFLSDD